MVTSSFAIASRQSAARPNQHWLTRPLAVSLVCQFLMTGLNGAVNAEGEGPAAQKTPLGQFVTVASPIDDVVFARISNAAVKLQNQGVQEGRTAFLVLQIEPGTSQFHHAQGLAKFLTSPQIGNVTTVAWIPETVTGANVLVALACRQIVMSPEAALGDIGRGKPLDREEQEAVLSLAQKRHNPKINSAIVRGMMDQQEQLWRVRLRSNQAGKDELETSVLTRTELDALRKTDVAIEGVDIVKEAGVLGTFRGAAARDLDILVVKTADSRAAVAELFGLPRESMREQTAEKELRKVRLIKIDGVVDRLQENFLSRQIERAISEQAQVIVFQIDSSHGHVDHGINLAQTIAQLEDRKIRTIAYIPNEAIQGAAVIALGCDEIIMHPDARLGNADPRESGLRRRREDEATQVFFRLKTVLPGIASSKHRPEAVCMAIADHTTKVFQATNRDNGRIWYMTDKEIRDSAGEWLPGPQLRETNGDQALVANGERAHELKLAEPPVHDINELKGRIGLPASTELRPVERTWVDDLVFTLNHPFVTVLLFILGVALIYMELHFMTGIMGIMSVLCFALFFWSRFLGGTAGWLEVVLFVIGVACLGLEIFVIPGFGVFGVSGILLILASLILAGHTWTVDMQTNIEELSWLTGQVLVSLAVVAAIGFGSARYLHRLPMFESMVLGPPSSDEDEPQLRTGFSRAESIHGDRIVAGLRGVSITMLRPAGKAKLDDHIVDVISEGPFISPESPIEVVSVSGNRIVVRQA